MTNNNERQEIEQVLQAHFAVTPEPEFVARLEQQLLAQTSTVTTSTKANNVAATNIWQRLNHWRGYQRWVMVTLTVLLIVMVTVVSLGGTQHVLAQIQWLLGYVPGIGFVALDESRLLAAPVEVSRDGITLRVEQVVAQPDQTTVIIQSEGLTAASSDDISQATKLDYEALLYLPDGQVLVASKRTLRFGSGAYEFPPLPVGVEQVTFELPRLPLVLPGVAPEAWQVRLSLQPASGELVAELFSLPYAPDEADDDQHDIRLQVSNIAHNSEETVINLQVQWAEPGWRLAKVAYSRSAQVQDDLGHIYHYVSPSNVGQTVQARIPPPPPPPVPNSTVQIESATEIEQVTEATQEPPTPTPVIPTDDVMLAFAPMSPSAQNLTLTVDDIAFDVEVAAEFTVDLGDNPQIGDFWPLDIDLMVAGFPVHIRGMRLTQTEKRYGADDTIIQETSLEFLIDPVPAQADRTLTGLRLDGRAAGFNGSGGHYSPISGYMGANINFEGDQPLPTEPILVQVTEADVVFYGPWQLSWSIPSVTDATRIKPIISSSSQPSQPRHDVTLQTGDAVLTDRLTQLAIEASHLPAGAVFEGVPYRPSVPSFQGWFVVDDQGQRYGLTNSVGWQPPDQIGFEDRITRPRYPAGLRQLTFEPISPAARSLTLEVAAVALFTPADATFEVTVPQQAKLNPSSDLPATSDPWPVDIPLEIAGHQVQFTEAQLQGLNRTILLSLTSAPLTWQLSEQQLTALTIASVSDPAGRQVNLKTANSYASKLASQEQTYQVSLSFDVANPTTRLVQPGRYQVALDGVLTVIEGPWTLRWDLE